MNTQLKILSAGILSLALAGCATGAKEQWQNFTTRPVVSQVAENDAALVFYRDNTGSDKTAVNIIINGEYMTSLQQNGFSQITTCALPQRIGAFVTGTDNQYLRKAGQGSFFNPAAGRASYFRVSVGADGQAVLTAVDADTARAQIDTGKFQSNTLQRVDKASTCVDRRQPRTYTLDASALFRFDQSAPDNILPDGREEIAAIARDIREYPVNIRAIEVVGHTDPQGDAAYNLRLSAARAQTVGNLLVQAGAPASLINARGVGETQPVIADCALRHKGNREAVNACNQPNRRVEVKLHAQQ
ncbi:OmpA family protein [Neisseria leonii]|uniref:OmpA family protein n=1 Tax=Neisseria leonii TaxID=2995413 RepID=UPI0030CACBE6